MPWYRQGVNAGQSSSNTDCAKGSDEGEDSKKKVLEQCPPLTLPAFSDTELEAFANRLQFASNGCSAMTVVTLEPKASTGIDASGLAGAGADGIGDREAVVSGGRLSEKQKHQIKINTAAKQCETLVACMQESELLVNGAFLVEFGAGRGTLSAVANRAREGRGGCILIDRDRARYGTQASSSKSWF
jgi:hypothetical protein